MSQGLREILEMFRDTGYSPSPYDKDEDCKISPRVFELGMQLINAIPSRLTLPKVSPDEGESLLMSWRDDEVVLVGINNDSTLDIIIDARSEHSIKYGNVPVSLDQLRLFETFPAELREALEFTGGKQ